MTDESSRAGAGPESRAEPSAESSSSRGLAFAMHTIKLHETAATHDFEALMIREVFPAVSTHDSGFGDNEPDQHFLLDGGSDREYVWMIRLDYFVHHVPAPTWLLNRAEESYASVKVKIEPFGTLVSSRTFYDVGRWRRRLGFD
jgi:hypothetical protein